MASSYEIISKVSETAFKVSMYVKFNGKIYDPKTYPNGGEWVEIESADPVEIDIKLTKIADDAAADTMAKAQKSDLKIVAGKLVPSKG